MPEFPVDDRPYELESGTVTNLTLPTDKDSLVQLEDAREPMGHLKFPDDPKEIAQELQQQLAQLSTTLGR
jgi:hypothetical protein